MLYHYASFIFSGIAVSSSSNLVFGYLCSQEDGIADLGISHVILEENNVELSCCQTATLMEIVIGVKGRRPGKVQYSERGIDLQLHL